PSQSPLSAPELAKKYPLILTTGSRIPQYTHTQFRNMPSLRKEAPEPIAEINPETAEKYGIADGDMMSIETPKGEIVMKVHTIEELSPGIVGIPHGWPEANANRLTSLDSRDPVTGYTEMKALLCRIRKV
ncbi:molybdopterin dinucleotide binding domain-containing protein, partial [Chloroflexota bacterium]